MHHGISAASFFEDFKVSKADLLSPYMITYIDNLVDGFDDSSEDVDPIAVSELEATPVDISTIVYFGKTLGHGKYGIVKSTGEEVAIKIIRKEDLSEKELVCLKVI